MSKLYAVAQSAKKLAGSIVSACEKGKPPLIIQRQNQNLFSPSIHQLKPEFILSNMSYMQRITKTANEKRSFINGAFLTVMLVLLSGLSLISTDVKAQAASTYIFRTSTGNSLETIISPTTLTSVSSGSADDGFIAITPASFSFTYAGTSYTNFTAGTNGYLLFGSSTPGTSIPSSLTTHSGFAGVYCFGRDGNLNTANGGDVTHGEAAGGKYVFQFTKNSGGGSGSTSATIYATYQVVLWGSTSASPGKIEIIYGANLGTPSSSGTIGIRDVANTLRNAVDGSTSASATAAAWPATGTKHSFFFPVPCTVAPTNQPTSLTLTPAGTDQINGSFTAASAGSQEATGYLVVRYPHNAAVTAPSDNVVYSAGGSLGLGTVVYTGAAVSFSSLGLTGSTQYDYYIYSYYDICTGILYLNTSPLTGSATTLAPSLPNCAAIVAPVSGATGQAVNVTLSWSAATGSPAVTGYDVYLSNNATLVTSLNASALVSSAQTTLTYTPALNLQYGTTYYWTIVPRSSFGAAVGCALNSFTTKTPATITSTAQGGLWTDAQTWVGGVAPVAGDNVTIADGSIVTINAVVNISSLTVGQGTSGILQWNATANALTVIGNLTIASGARFLPYSTSSTGVTLNIGGNFTNDGYANLSLGSTLLNFNGSQQGGGSLTQTLGGSGTFQGDGTYGIIRALFFQTAGASVISSSLPQTLVTGSFGHTAGSLNTNGKLRIDNVPQVYGQALNLQVANVAVTTMGNYSVTAPVVFGVAVTQWSNISGTLNTLYVSGNNVYRCILAANIGPSAPTHTSGISQNLLWVGTVGTLGTPFLGAQTHSVGSQYFYGGNLYTCTVAGAGATAAPPTHTSGAAVSGAATFLYVGSPATATVNYNTGATLNVRSVNLTNAGSGYTSAPSIAFSIGAGSTQTTAASATAVYIQSVAGPANSLTQKSGSATISGGLTINNTQGASAQSGVGAVFATNGGVNYTVAPTVGFAGPTGINLVTNSGSGYAAAPTITVTGGTLVSGSALTSSSFTITVAQGQIVSVYLNSGTSATYSVPPTLAFSAGSATLAFPAGCWPAATASIGSNGQITNFTVTNAGYGYVAAPTVGVGTTSGNAVGGTFTTVASGLSSRLALYNITYNNFTPSTSNAINTEGAEIPSNRKINALILGSPGLGAAFTGNLEIFGSSTPITLTYGTLDMGGNNLLFSWNSYNGVTATLSSYVKNASITLTTKGGNNSLTYPFDAPFVAATGTGSVATGSTITTLTARVAAAPTGTATNSTIGSRTYRATVNAGAVYGTNPTVTLAWNAIDSFPTTLDKQYLFAAQSTATTGPWTTRSAAQTAGTIPVTGTVTTATTVSGPIVPTGDDYYGWVTNTPPPTVTALSVSAFCSAGGQTVTITGTLFTGVTAVKFNGVDAASYTVNSATSITAVTPSGITAGNVTVTAKSITSAAAAESAYTVTVTPTFAPTVTPSNGLVCSAGGSVVIALNDIGADSYTWSGAGLDTYSGLSVTATPSVTTAYVVTAPISASGCTVTKTFYVGVVPGSATTPTASPATFCLGSTPTVDLNSNLSAGSFGVSSITYAPASEANATGGIVTSVVTNSTANIPLSGGSLDDGGWSNLPIGFSYNFFGTSFSTFTLGTNGTLFFGAVPGYGVGQGQAGQYQFASFPSAANPGNVIAMSAMDLNLNTSQGVIKYWNDGVAPTRRLIVQYSNAQGYVGSTAGIGSQTFQCILYETTGVVEIHYLQATDNTHAKTIGLQNFDGSIGASAPGRNGTNWLVSTPEAWRFSPPANYEYLWTPSTNLSSNTVSAPVYTVTGPGVFPIALQVTNPVTGCVNNSSVTITINPTPSNPVVSPASPSVCGTSTTTLTVGAPTPGNVIRWYDAPIGGTLLATGTSFTTPVLSANATYYVAEEGSPCSSNRTAVAVTWSAAPSISVGNTNPFVCAPGGVSTLSATSSNPNYNYTWTESNPGTLSSLTGTPVTATVTSTTNYTVSALDNTGCATSAATVVTVTPTPVITSVTATPATVCSGSTVNLTATSIANGPGGTVTVGTGTSLTGITEELTAFCNRRASYRVQLLFTAAELNAAGLQAGDITKVGFNISSVGDATTNANFTVKMGATALTELTDYVGSGSFTTVFPAATYTHAVGLNQVTFSTPFNWDGTSNVIVEVSHNGIDDIDNAETYYTETPDNTVAYGYNAATTATLSTRRFNTVFTGVAATDVTGSYTWNWTTTLVGPAIASGAVTTHAPVNIGTSPASGTYTATAILNGCDASLTSSSITVNPQAVAPTDNSVTPQCGQPTFAVSTSVASPVIKWYSAASGGTLLFTGATGVLTYTPVTYTAGATNTVYASVTNSFGCESARGAVAVFVNTPPALDITPSGAQNACVNDIKTISVTAGTVGNYSNFVWSPAAHLYTSPGATAGTEYDGTSSVTTIYYKATSASSDFITLTATGGGCAATTSVTFNVSAYPVISTAKATPASVCSGANISLAATTIAGAAGSGTITGSTTSDFGSGVYRHGFGNGDFRHQLIYTAAEMSAAGFVAGNISSLSFNVDATGSGTYNNYIIRMANIGATNAVSTSFITLPVGYTEVFNAPTLASPSATGPFTHTFSNNFDWDGTSNILIDICYNVSAASGTTTLIMTNNTTQNCQLLGSTNACTATSGATVMSFRPIISFTGTVGADVTFENNWVWFDGVTPLNTSNTTGLATVAAPTTLTQLTKTYSVTATNAAGCSISTNANTVTVYPLAIAPADQATALTVSNITNTSFTSTLGAAPSAPTGYIIVRYTDNTTITPPVNSTTYTVSQTLGAGTVVAVGNSLTLNETGLTGSTTYYYYVYTYNTSLCLANTYNTTNPLTQTVLTCAEATGVPGTPASSLLTTNGFTATWTASSTAGVDYTIEVATDAAFTNMVSGYPQNTGVGVLSKTVTDLQVATIYYVRVRATLGGSCNSPYSGTLTVATVCNPVTTFPYLETFEGVTAPALPVCWSVNNVNTDGDTWITYNDAAYAKSGTKSVGIYTDGNGGVNDDYLILPQMTLGTAKKLRFSARVRSSSEPNDFRVVLSTTDNLPASFTNVLLPLTSISSTTYADYVVDLSSYTGTVYIAFHVPSGGLDGWYLYLDDISIADSCIAPVLPATALNLTPQSGAVSGSFTPSASATDYLVVETPGITAATAPVNGTSYTAGSSALGGRIISAGTATNFLATSLIASTQYTYTVFAYTNSICVGGPLYLTSSSLSGSVNTLAGQTITSVTSGSWKNPATWSTGYVPSRNDFVVIAPGHTVTIDTTAYDSTLLVSQSAILQYDTTIAYTLTSGSNVTINGPGIFRSALTGTQTGHNLIVYGNLTVNPGGGGAVLDFSTNNNTAGANLIFKGATNNTYTADGNTNDLRTLTIDKGTDITSTLEITSSGFTVRGTSAPVTTADSTAHGFLTLTNGQLKISTATSPTLSRLFSTTSYTIPSTAGLWLNTAALTVQGMSGSSPTVNGSLRITAGTFNVGRSSDNSLGAGTNAVFNIEGGALNVAGRFTSTSDVNYTQSAGVVTVNTVGNTSSSVPSFGFTSSAPTNSFTMSGGTIVLQKASTGFTQFDYRNHSGTVNITGGAVQFGTASSTAASTFVLTNSATTSAIVAPAIIVGVPGVAQTLSIAGTSGTGPALIYGNLTVNTGSTINHLNTGGQQIRVTGDVINNGTIAQGASASSGNRFFFDSTGAARTYTGTGTFGSNTIPYPGIAVTNPNGVDLSAATNNIIASRIELLRGAVTGGNKVTLGIGGASSAFVQRGGIVYANAGTIDAAPVNNAGTGGFGVIYSSALNAVTSGVEIPASRTLKLFQTSNTNTVTLAGGNVSTDSLVMAGGNIVNDASNILSVTGAAANKVNRTSGWVTGPMQRAVPSGATTGTFVLPVGKTTYAGFELIDPTMASAGSIAAEFFEDATNGFPGILMNNLNEQGYWQATDLATALTSTRIRVTSPVVLNPGTDALAQSNDATLTGTYDYIGASSPNVPAGTISSDPTPPLVTSLGYFTLGTKGIPMIYDSATTFQTPGTTNITAGVTNQMLIGVRVHTTNNNPPMTLNSMTFNLQGSKALANLDVNLSAVRLFSTGNSNTFATTTQVGNQIEPPFVDPYEFTISDAVSLLPGDNYFWLAVDVPASATLLDTLDARCTSINITDNNTFNTFDSIPRVTNPNGNKVIKTILNGDYSIGSGNISGEAGHYATLTAAITVLNDVGVAGPVKFVLTDTAYKATTGETFPLIITAFPGASTTNRLTIKPNTGVNTTVRGTSSSAVIVLNGADYVTIDGSFSSTANTVCPSSSASRNLTIINTGTSTTSAVIWLQANATDSATNNTIQNCNIIGNSNTTTLIGVGAGAAISASTLPVRANINNSYVNNNISKTQYGIVTQGVSAARKTSGTLISQNLINTAAPDNIQRGGILVGFDNGVVISGNKIAGTTSADCFGVSLGNTSISTSTLTGNEVINATISNNNISNLMTTSSSSAVGILVMSAASGINTISNNMIYGLNSQGTGGDVTAGIFIGGGAGTTNIYYNTISLTGDRGSTSGSLYPSYALAIGGTNPIVNVRNNILHNSQTSNSTSTTFRSYAIALGYTTFTNLTSDNNDLFVSGANAVFGLRGSLVPTSGTAVANLAAWQTNPGKDLNSKNVAPVFISSTDLHLLGTDASNVANLVGTGAAVSVTQDIDCETRATASTIGADELVPCTGAIGGTLTTPVTTFCASSAAGTTITASGYSTPLNGSYQWQSSSTLGFETPVNIAGATNPATYIISPAVTTTTYFRLKARCSTSADSAYSNTITITINASPTAIVAAQGGIVVFCTPIPNTVTLNGSTDLSSPTPVYQWQLNGADISGANSASYSVPSLQAGNYTLKVTNTATACVGTSAITAVSTSARPGAISFTPPTPAICSGQNASITATGGLVGGTGSVAIGAGASTISGTTTGFGNPYNYWYGGMKTQFIYTKAELNAAGITAGNISAIATQITALGSPALVMNNFTINMGHTTQAAATTTLITSALTPVYSNASQGVNTGANTYTFGSPFAWNGLDNVVVSISWSNANAGGSGSSATVAGDNAGFTSTSILYADNTSAANLFAASSNTSSGIGTTNNLSTTTQRPKITFTYSTLAAPVWSWAASTDLNTTSGATVIATPAATSGTVNYTATATSPAGCATSNNVTVTINPLPTVAADSASFRYRLSTPQTTTLPYTATQSPTTYSIVWGSAAQAELFVDVTDAVLGASPVTLNIPANVNAGTYTGTISVKNANTCLSAGDEFTLLIANANPVWTGNTSTDWNTGSNWSTGIVPAPSVSVTIDKTGSFNPVLTGDISIGGALDIAPNNTVTIGGNSLTVTGGITNNTGTLVGSNTSNLTVGAASTLRFATGGGTLKNLTVNAGTTTLATALDITGGSGGINNNTYGTVTVANGATIASGGNLTFKSNASGTARLASGATTGQWITGNVTVERYIPANAQRAWRFLSVPTKGTQTIKQSWQENSSPSNLNPKPGFGTNISSSSPSYGALGFDDGSARTSLQFYNQSTGAWIDVTSTLAGGNVPKIESVKGFSMYIRGDRTEVASGAVTSTSPTTLRTTGTLYTGNQAAISIAASKFDVIGNTYVSAIDFLALSKTGINNALYLWDPKLVTGTPPNQQLGGYVTFALSNGWVGIPNSSSYGTTPHTTIQSGEAFMVKAGAGGGTISLVESAKVAGDGANMFRPVTGFEKLKANLYTISVDNIVTMADANVSVFDNMFSNEVDGDDASKLTNAGENFAIRRDNRNLVVEGRQVITDYDTTYFNTWNLRQQIQYRFEFIAENMNIPGRSAYLMDNFTNTTTQLDLTDTTIYNFTITPDAPSFASNRFKVVYRQVELAPVPVSFVSLNAQIAGAAVKLDWKVTGESGIRQYIVERSSDNNKFSEIGNVTATGNRNNDVAYAWMDANPLSGSNFYRIKSVGVAGDIKYSYIAKVLMGSVKPSFTIAPNPVEGSVINIQFKNQQSGRYNIRLMTAHGETVFTTIKEHIGGNGTQVINLPGSIARGAYQLEIISPDKKKEVQNLFINTLK